MICSVQLVLYYILFCNVQRVLQAIHNTDQAAFPGGSGTGKTADENSAANHKTVGAASAKSKNVVTDSKCGAGSTSSSKASSSASSVSSTSSPPEMLVFSSRYLFLKSFIKGRLL